MIWQPRKSKVFGLSPPPSSPLTGPSALWPGHLWDQTGRCSRRSSWPEPPDRPHCSTETSPCTTCWTDGWEQNGHTFLPSPGPCSYLGKECQKLNLLWCRHTAPFRSTEEVKPVKVTVHLWLWFPAYVCRRFSLSCLSSPLPNNMVPVEKWIWTWPLVDS